MTDDEIIAELTELINDMFDASIEHSLGGGIGGCRAFDINNYPPKFHASILSCIDNDYDSVRATFYHTLQLLKEREQ